MPGGPGGAPLQIVSAGAHTLSVLGAYDGPIDDGRRLDSPHELSRRLTDQDHRRDVVSYLRWHGIRDELSELAEDSLGYLSRGDIARHDRALRESAENDFGFGAVRRGRLDVQTRVPDPIDDGSGELDAVAEIAAGRVVDRIYVHRPRSQLASAPRRRTPVLPHRHRVARRSPARTPPRHRGTPCAEAKGTGALNSAAQAMMTAPNTRARLMSIAPLYPLLGARIQACVGSLTLTSILPMFAPVNRPFMASTHDSMPS